MLVHPLSFQSSLLIHPDPLEREQLGQSPPDVFSENLPSPAKRTREQRGGTHLTHQKAKRPDLRDKPPTAPILALALLSRPHALLSL